MSRSAESSGDGAGRCDDLFYDSGWSADVVMIDIARRHAPMTSLPGGVLKDAISVSLALCPSLINRKRFLWTISPLKRRTPPPPPPPRKKNVSGLVRVQSLSVDQRCYKCSVAVDQRCYKCSVAVDQRCYKCSVSVDQGYN